jgi:hypothetical protein
MLDKDSGLIRILEENESVSRELSLGKNLNAIQEAAQALSSHMLVHLWEKEDGTFQIRLV